MKTLTSATPAVTAGTELGLLFQRYRTEPILLLLSGGSALDILEHIPMDAIDSRVTITTLDERYSHDPAINNFAQITETDFYQRVRAVGVSMIDTTVNEGETLAGAGDRFSQSLQQWRDEHPTGVVLAVLGVGADGHTAGIFPHQPMIDFNGPAWVVAYTISSAVANPHRERFTVTNTFLRHEVAGVLVYAAGEEKRPIVERLQSAECPGAVFPICIAHELPAVTLVTDIERRCVE